MSGTVLLWILLFCLLAAIGNCTLRIIRRFGGKEQSSPDPFFAFWTGLAITVAVLQLASLILPLDRRMFTGFILIGSFALANTLSKKVPPRFVQYLRDPWTLALGSGALLFVFITAYGSTSPELTNGYDTLLYHWGALRWMNTFPAVPGLANLHIRLGTPSGWLVFAGLLDNGPMDGRTAWVLCGFPLAVLHCQWFHFLHPLKTRDSGTRLFLILSLPFLIYKSARMSPSLYFDLPAHLLLMVCLLELFQIRAGYISWTALTADDFTRLLVPAALSFAIKPIGAPVLILIVLAWLLHAGPRILQHRSLLPVCWPCLIPALLAFGWLARNAILTGWLCFPMPLAALPVDWRVPENPPQTAVGFESMQTVRGQLETIKGWARDKGIDTYKTAIHAPIRNWAPVWFRRYQHRVEIGWLLPLTGLFILGLVTAMIGQRKPAGFDCFLLLGLCLQLGFWFESAPDLRFADGLIWMGVALTASRLLHRILPESSSTAIAICLTLCLSSAAIPHLIQIRKTATGRIIGHAYPMPVKAVTVQNGQMPHLIVWFPLHKDLCGDAPIPSTPYIQDRLHWREPGNLRKGFFISDPL